MVLPSIVAAAARRGAVPGTADAGNRGPASGGGGSDVELYGGLPRPLSPNTSWTLYQGLLLRYQADLAKALDQVVWIDFVCQNQHAATKKDYSRVAKTVVACGATVCVMDRGLTPLRRTWCLFELMHCLRCKRHLKVFFVENTALPDDTAARLVEGISVQDSKASCDEDRVGILQEVINTVGASYVNDTIRKAMRLTNTERARQLALRREQLATTMGLLEPDPAVIGTEEYEENLAKCREHLHDVLHTFYPEDVLRCIIPKDYVSDSARCWDMLCIFAEILERELFREDAKTLKATAWLIFKRHSKRYIEVLYEKELDNWLQDSLEHDRKWRRMQAKLKHDQTKKWSK